MDKSELWIETDEHYGVKYMVTDARGNVWLVSRPPLTLTVEVVGVWLSWPMTHLLIVEVPVVSTGQLEKATVPVPLPAVVALTTITQNDETPRPVLHARTLSP